MKDGKGPTRTVDARTRGLVDGLSEKRRQVQSMRRCWGEVWGGGFGWLSKPRINKENKKNFRYLSLQAKDVFINVRTAIRDVRAQCQDYRSKARQKESE